MTKEAHDELIRLRLGGMSILEICANTGLPKTTVQRHVKGTEVPQEFLKQLREKQGGAKQRALGLRENSLENASAFLGDLSERDYMLLLIGFTGVKERRRISL